MKLLKRKTIGKEVSTNPKAHTKSHKNELPSDDYKDLIPPVNLTLTDTSKVVISVKRGGEYGLPKVDIRLFVDTASYTGPTTKGINLYLDKLPELNTYLHEVEEMCGKLKLFDEFEKSEEEEDESEE